MSDKRTIEQIQSDYQATCTRAGHIRYQISAFEDDLKLVLSKLKDLNLEAVAVQSESKQPEPSNEPGQQTESEKVSS